MSSRTIDVIRTCWEAGCSNEQIAYITKQLTGTWLSEAAVEDHIAQFEVTQP